MENVSQLNPTQKYLVKVFDGEYSEQQIREHRKTVFWDIINFVSPKSGTKVADVCTSDEIGEIINELANIQRSRRLAKKIAKLEEAPF